MRFCGSLAVLLILASCQTRGGATGAPRVAAGIALCQIEVGPHPEDNLRTIEAALAEAAAQGAQLAVFPEACLFGWTNSAAHAGAQPIPGAYLERLAAAARRDRIMLAIGMEERGEAGLHNTVVLLDAEGRLLGRHRKVNILDELMDPPYTPGDGKPIVLDTALGRIGLLICADTFQTELVDALAAERPDLVLVPFGWAAPAEAWPEHGQSLHAWIAHTARVCGAPVVGVDSVGQIHDGPWRGQVLGGQSQAVDASGQPQLTLADRQAEILTWNWGSRD